MARFGFNRYALVLVALGFAGLGSGCGGGGSGGGSASTVAPSTSGSNAAPTTSSTTTAPVASAAVLSGVAFVDVDASQTITKGDKLVCSFSGDLTPIAASNTIDPTQEFALAVGGDSFGANATVAPGAAANEVAIVLGDAPVLQISETFSVARTTPGSGSGLNVSPFAKGDIKSREGVHVAPAAMPLDVTGSLQPGFRAAPSLNVARGAHVAVTLDDGRVLVVGGLLVGSSSKANEYVAEAEIFDPLAGSWTKVSDLSGSRMMNGRVQVKPALCTATKLNDGTVLICGGLGVERRGFLGLGRETVDTLDSAFIFDPTTNTFTKVGDMNWSRHSHTATIMSDGRVLIAGGYSESFWKSDKTAAPFEIYDPAKKKFEPSGSIFSRFKSVEPRQSHSATAIEGGSGILLAGGNHWEGGFSLGPITISRPRLKINKGSEVVRGLRTERAGDLLTPRLNHGAAPAGPRGVLIAGGHDGNGPVAGLELYDTATAQWAAAGNLATPRSGCEIAVDRNLLLVIGGYTGTAETASVEVFDADAKALSATTYTLANARNGCAVVTLKDGRILVTGGLTGATKSFDSLDGQAIASCEVFVRQ